VAVFHDHAFEELCLPEPLLQIRRLPAFFLQGGFARRGGIESLFPDGFNT